MNFEKKIVVVTGGGSGIGRAICKEFAEHKATVVVTDINQSGAEGVVQEIKNAGGVSKAIAVNVTDEASVKAMVADTVAEFGRIDVLVNNAGVISSMKNVEDITIDEWEKMFAVNTKGVFICSKAVIPQMKKQGYGRILNTASQAGKKGLPLLGHYCASKAAVILLTKTMALELATTGVHVNSVCPGSINTDMTVMETKLVSKITGQAPELLLEQWTNAVPMKKLGTPKDVAKVFLFLASEYADYMTGQAVNVSGGQEMN